LSRAGARVVESGSDGRTVLDEDAWARLRALPDPRSPRGRVYDLASLVAIAVCAFTVAGHDRLTAVGQWIKRATPADLAAFGLPWDPFTGAFRVPDEKTIRTLLDGLDPRALSRALLGQRLAHRGQRRRPDGTPSRSVRDYRSRRAAAAAKALARSRIHAVSVDGKTSRGARRADGSRVHLLGVLAHGGPLLDQVEVDAKHNEVTHFTTLLADLDLDGVTVTFDALHTVRENLNWLVEKKNAHYIAVIKKNQPIAYARVKKLPWRHVTTASTTREHGHGRTETRTLKVLHIDRLHHRHTIDLPHARQAIKITRWRQDDRTNKITRETVYLITSLTCAQADADDLGRLVREHWHVEAHHHVRDVSFGEDTSTSRTGHGPVNLATLRAAVVAALHDAGYLHIPEGRRDHTTPAETRYLHGLTTA
jgi:predicted transposase YbfD/YdcC